MIFELIASLIASMFFFPVLAVLVILLWISAEKESTWAVVVTGALGFLAYQGFPQLAAFFSSPVNILATVVGYMVLGIAWSFMKWYMVINKMKTGFVAFRDAYLALHKLPAGYFSTAVDENDKDNVTAHTEYIDAIHRQYTRSYGSMACMVDVASVAAAIKSIRPKASTHKASIMFWIGYWPFSVIWFVISDMVREFAEFMYNKIAGTFQRLSDRMFADLA